MSAEDQSDQKRSNLHPESYSRTLHDHNERGEKYELIVYATTASALFPRTGDRRMTRREWLELKSRVKITRGDNYLLIAFWVGVVITVVSQIVIGLGVIT
jgi:hypothetical protein